MLLMALDLVVFLDYGHWRLAPWLAHPALQAIGLALYFAVTLWQIWTDAYLARYFNRGEIALVPMNFGPYRHVRHPRYAAAIAGKVAMALTFASVYGWIMVIAWGLLLLNKIAVEEKHFWFRTRNILIGTLATRAIQGIESPRILEIGCGTGNVLGALDRARADSRSCCHRTR